MVPKLIPLNRSRSDLKASNLSESAVNEIQDLFVLRKYPKGSMIILEEEYGDIVFIVNKGTINNYNKDNMYLDISATMYENLRKKTKDRYEHILPNIIYGKTFFTEKFGTLDFKSNALYKNYDANKHTSIFTNDVLWSPGSKITKLGFVNRLEGMIRNTNYEAKNTNDYKTAGIVNELTGVLSYKSSLPMERIVMKPLKRC